MTQHDDSQTENTATHSPGFILKQAREVKGITAADIAAKMHISVRVILEIEEDNHRHMLAPIYLRGYLRSYARIVGIPEEKVLQACEAMGFAGEPSMQERANAVAVSGNFVLPVQSSYSGNRRRSLLRWLTIGIAVLLVILVSVWWHDQKHSQSHASVTVQTQQSQALPIEKAVITEHDIAAADEHAKPSKYTKLKKTPSKKIVLKIQKKYKANSLRPDYTVRKVSH